MKECEHGISGEPCPDCIKEYHAEQSVCSNELLSCPFCGGFAIFDKPRRGWGMWVRCTECPAEMFGINEVKVTDPEIQKTAVRELWNTRAE